MKTLEQEIAYYTKQAEKITSSYGIGSDASMSAIFKLKAVQSGMPIKDIFDYSRKEMERMHEMELDQCNSMFEKA